MKGREVAEHVLKPFRVFFEEDGISAGVEGGPHGRIVAEAENEEVAGGTAAEDVVGNGNLGP